MHPAAGPSDAAMPRPYRLRVVPAAPALLDAQVLACVTHGGANVDDGDPRRIEVGLPLLGGAGVEIWDSATPVRHGRDGDIGYAENGEVLFGQLRIADAGLDDAEAASFDAYARIEALLQRAGYPAWLRVWNYIPGITHGNGDDERYRRFVLGRYRALAHKPRFETELPAATAIGTRGGGLLIHFIAARRPGLQIENPRQTSAFRYPRQYGPKSPSFSRANLLHWQDGAELFVSGTASIVGHQTLHSGSPPAQLDETLANIAALLDGTAQRWQPQLLKLYLREPALLDAVRARFDAAFAAEVPRMLLLGEICRADLDLEIEALFRAAD